MYRKKRSKILILVFLIMFILINAFSISEYLYAVRPAKCSITEGCISGGQITCSCDGGPCHCTAKLHASCYCDCPWWEGDSSAQCSTP